MPHEPAPGSPPEPPDFDSYANSRGIKGQLLRVVKGVAEAKDNKIIAYEMGLTEGTIKEYLNRVFRRLGASNRTEVAVWAIHMGYRGKTAPKEAKCRTPR